MNRAGSTDGHIISTFGQKIKKSDSILHHNAVGLAFLDNGNVLCVKNKGGSIDIYINNRNNGWILHKSGVFSDGICKGKINISSMAFMKNRNIFSSFDCEKNEIVLRDVNVNKIRSAR